MNFHARKAGLIFWVIITIIPVVGIIISLSDPQTFSAAQNIWRSRIENFGIFAPLGLIILQILQVIITPISHYSIGVLGGFLFGPYLGGLYNWIGRTIGHTIAFFIARFAGRRIAEKFISPDTLSKYDKWVSDKSLVLFLLYFLPIFPDDELSYLAGLSKMETKRFIVANLLGHIGGSFSLAYVGAGINTKDPLFLIMIAVTFIIFIVFWWLTRTNKKIRANLSSNIVPGCQHKT